MKMDEESEPHREIPGLPEPEVKGKKGKKKGNSKKTLTLQNFLHDNSNINQSYGGSQTDHSNKSSLADESNGGSQSDGLNKPALSDEESAILESCHSYIHDYLKQRGPTNAHDSGLQQEIQSFPEEAKRVMTKVGGYKAFILLCKDLVVVDKIVGAKVHLNKAQELAFKEICNNLSQSGPSTSESRSIWGSNNSTSQISKGSLWSTSNTGYSDNTNIGSGSLHYHTSTQPVQNEDHDMINNSSKGVIGSNLKNGFLSSGSTLGSDSTFNEELQNKIWSLTLSNNQLVKQLNEKEKQSSEMESRINQLLAEKQAAKDLLNQHREEIDSLKKELQEARGEKQPDLISKTELNQRSDNDRDLILSLQKQLDAEKLRNMNLSQKQVETQMPGLSLQSETSTGLLSSLNPSINRNSGGFGGFGLTAGGGGGGGTVGTLDSDPFGLRSMSMNTGGMPLPSTADLKVGQSLFGAIGSDLTKPRGLPTLNSTSSAGMNQSNSRGTSPGLPSPSQAPGFPGSPFTSGLGLPMTGFTSVMPAPQTSSIGQQHLLGPYGSQSSLVSSPTSLAPGGRGGLRGLVGNPPGVGQSLGVDQQQLLKSPVSQNLGLGGVPGQLAGVPGQLGAVPGQLGVPGQMVGVPGQLGGVQGQLGVVQGQMVGVPGQLGGVQAQLGGVQGQLGVQGQMGGVLVGANHVGGSEPNSAPGTPAPVSRQDQLVKKLMLYINTSEENVKHYIQVLRERHGKLSGWATSRIAEEIVKLMKQQQQQQQ